MARPFRLLIRNASIIRKQLQKLEEKFRCVFVLSKLQIRSSDQVRRDPESLESPSRGLSEEVPRPEDKANEDKETKNEENRKGKDDDKSTENLGDAKDDTEPKVEPFETKEALEHFRMLMVFVDVYLERGLKKYEDYQIGKSTTIAFEDLWMIFDVGETIYCPFRKGGIEIQTD